MKVRAFKVSPWCTYVTQGKEYRFIPRGDDQNADFGYVIDDQGDRITCPLYGRSAHGVTWERVGEGE